MGIAANYTAFGVDAAAVREMVARDCYFADLIEDYWSLAERIERESSLAASDLARRKARLEDMISDILIAEMA